MILVSYLPEGEEQGPNGEEDTEEDEGKDGSVHVPSQPHLILAKQTNKTG